MSKVRLVFAQGTNREFGNGDGLPWGHCKSDFKSFREDTMDSICLMGSKTWESLPTTLVGRVNAVMSRNPVWNKKDECPDFRMKGDLASAIYELKMNYPDKDINIIGGLSMLEEGLDFADEIYMSMVLPSSQRFPATRYMSIDFYLKMKSMFPISECIANEIYDVSQPILGWSKFKLTK